MTKKHLPKMIGLSIISILIIILIVGTSNWMFNNMIEAQRQTSWSVLKGAADNLNNTVKAVMNRNINAVKLSSATMSYTDVNNRDIMSEHLSELYKLTDFDRIDCFYPDNTLLMINEECREAAPDIVPLKFEKIISENITVSLRNTDFHTGEQCVYVPSPVIIDGEAKAVIIGVLKCSTIAKLFSATVYGDDASIYIVDSRDGSFIMNKRDGTEGNFLEDLRPREPLEGYPDVDMNKAVTERQTGTRAWVSLSTGKPSYMYFRPVTDSDWMLLINSVEDVIFADALSLRSTLEIAILAETIFLIMLFVFLGYAVHLILLKSAQLEQVNVRIADFARTDVLTGARNRIAYFEATETADEAISKGKADFAVAVMDINGLKAVNDTNGHEAGDEYINSCYNSISKAFSGQTIYRIGGDEFVVILTDYSTDLLENISFTAVNESKFKPSVAYGYSVFDPSSDKDYADVFNRADDVMYRNKDNMKKNKQQ